MQELLQGCGSIQGIGGYRKGLRGDHCISAMSIHRASGARPTKCYVHCCMLMLGWDASSKGLGSSSCQQGFIPA